jgi:uncharacterized protein YqgV (UPF0045/DUF77 family)
MDRAEPASAVAAQLSVYPLRQEHLGPAVARVEAVLRAHGLAPVVGPMSSLVTGETGRLFAALAAAFDAVAADGQVVMTLTVSNACPVPG